MNYTAFSIGDRVEVLNVSCYKKVCVGDIGTIRNVYANNLRVAIDDK